MYRYMCIYIYKVSILKLKPPGLGVKNGHSPLHGQVEGCYTRGRKSPSQLHKITCFSSHWTYFNMFWTWEVWEPKFCRNSGPRFCWIRREQGEEVTHDSNSIFYGHLYNQRSQMADLLLSIHVLHLMKSVAHELGLTYEELLIDSLIIISITSSKIRCDLLLPIRHVDEITREP